PSLPNYFALVAGTDNGVSCDCDPTGSACNQLTCNILVHACGCPQKLRHIGDDVEAAGLTWRAYAESMGAPCKTSNAGDYATRHVPFVYFSGLVADAGRCAAHVVDYGEFARDLGGVPSAFSYIAPTLVHDMHDPFPAGAQNLANGDAWLASEMPA